MDAVKPDTSQGEVPLLPIYESRRGPRITSEVDFWTSRDVREVTRSHLNYRWIVESAPMRGSTLRLCLLADPADPGEFPLDRVPQAFVGGPALAAL